MKIYTLIFLIGFLSSCAIHKDESKDYRRVKKIIHKEFGL